MNRDTDRKEANVKLKLDASGTKLYPNIAVLRDAHIIRYIGKRSDASKGGFVPTGPEDIEADASTLSDYVRAVQSGDLIAADEDTARYCNVPFQK